MLLATLALGDGVSCLMSILLVWYAHAQSHRSVLSAWYSCCCSFWPLSLLGARPVSVQLYGLDHSDADLFPHSRLHLRGQARE
jgi:hypothetical protein